MLRLVSIKSKPYIYFPLKVFTHSKTCPEAKSKTCPDKAGDKGGGEGSTGKGSQLIRAEKSSPCRYGFIPDEWFTFFHSKTGVSGPYVLGIGLINYLVSKEIYIMEHEYYSGLSIALVIYLVTTKMGPGIGKSLDDMVDAEVASWEAGRKNEMALYETTIKECTLAQQRAMAQKLLMDAKKENIAMQLEAIYRERLMQVYRSVKGRMDYHVKLYRAEARIHQRWMISWILNNVMKSITPEFEQQALNSAIQELTAVAGRAK